jgi:ornithine decarboxylase
VKCNDDMRVLQTLAILGCSFDCASAGEIKRVLSLDVDPNRIIFANTTKQSTHIEYAKACNVNLMTFDNEDEVYKIAKLHPSSE